MHALRGANSHPPIMPTSSELDLSRLTKSTLAVISFRINKCRTKNRCPCVLVVFPDSLSDAADNDLRHTAIAS
jgi:hypothetical protein